MKRLRINIIPQVAIVIARTASSDVGIRDIAPTASALMNEVRKAPSNVQSELRRLKRP
ncbi:hypothetical protein D3C84_598470 [compost metagenome]